MLKNDNLIKNTYKRVVYLNMKLILIVALLMPALSFAQVDTLPFKKCNTITVAFSGNSDSVYKKLVNVLLDKGYTMEKRDSEFRTLETSPNRVGNFGAWKKINIRVSDSKVVMSMPVSLFNATSFNGSYISYGGTSKSMNDISWPLLEEVASSINGIKTYSIR